MKIRFIKSPTGQPYFLSYSAGQFADLPDDLAEKLVRDNLAIEVEAGERLQNHQTAEKRETIQGDNGAGKRGRKPKRSQDVPKD